MFTSQNRYISTAIKSTLHPQIFKGLRLWIRFTFLHRGILLNKWYGTFLFLQKFCEIGYKMRWNWDLTLYIVLKNNSLAVHYCDDRTQGHTPLPVKSCNLSILVIVSSIGHAKIGLKAVTFKLIQSKPSNLVDWPGVIKLSTWHLIEKLGKYLLPMMELWCNCMVSCAN